MVCTLADFRSTSHHSAESCISIRRLRCRFRIHAPTTPATTMMPSAAPTITPVEAQPVALNAHRLTAPSASASTIITMVSLISECVLCVSMMNIISGLRVSGQTRIGGEGTGDQAGAVASRVDPVLLQSNNVVWPGQVRADAAIVWPLLHGGFACA